MGSQFNESQILRQLLPERWGTYVDVGAGDPWQLSNTGDLYLAGWHGLLIEPLPDRCDRLRRERPRDVVINCAVADIEGWAELYVADELSSLDPLWPNESQKRQTVRVQTLSSILAGHPELLEHCDVCSIDVEGFEYQVLKGTDLSTFRPEVFVVESLSFQTLVPQWPKWEPLLLDAGYEFVVAGDLGLNRFYQRSDLIPELVRLLKRAGKRYQRQRLGSNAVIV